MRYKSNLADAPTNKMIATVLNSFKVEACLKMRMNIPAAIRKKVQINSEIKNNLCLIFII